MKKLILRADGRVEKLEVGNGFETWNAAINADIGTIVQAQILDTEKGQIRDVELWCDEEALCKAEPVLNLYATMMAGRGHEIYGDVIVFDLGDIK